MVRVAVHAALAFAFFQSLVLGQRRRVGRALLRQFETIQLILKLFGALAQIVAMAALPRIRIQTCQYRTIAADPGCGCIEGPDTTRAGGAAVCCS